MRVLMTSPLTSSNYQEKRTIEWYNTAVRISVLAGAFCVIVLLCLLHSQVRIARNDPRTNPSLVRLKEQLLLQPKNASLVLNIRRVDARVRYLYWRDREFSHVGVYVLLFAVGVFLLSASAAFGIKHKFVLAQNTEVKDALAPRLASVKWAVGFALATMLGLAVIALTSPSDNTSGYLKIIHKAEAEKKAAADTFADTPAQMANATSNGFAQTASLGAAPKPLSSVLGLETVQPASLNQMGPGVGTVAQGNQSSGMVSAATSSVSMQAQPLITTTPYDTNDYAPDPGVVSTNWPMFRGPNGLGVAAGVGYPTMWNAKTGDNINWSTPIPLPGWNSPVVWNNCVFLSGADKDFREVYCIDVTNGNIVWKRRIDHIAPDGKPIQVMQDTGYAASTMAVDGKHVFAIFPNGDLICLDFDGNILWSKSFGPLENAYGHASSLAFYKNLLIVQLDQGSSAQDNKSVLYALQAGTGAVVWYTRRSAPNTWTTPIIGIIANVDQLITAANPWAISYEALTGKEIWRANVLGGEMAPSPAYIDGTAFFCNLGAQITAIKIDGAGDVTKTKIVWSASDGLPDITSPLAYSGHVYTVTTDGIITCFEASSGKKLWEHAYETTFNASPVAVGSSIYLTSSDGITRVIDIGKAFVESSRGSVGETCHATPAFVAGKIYVRGEKHLFSVGTK